MYWFIWAVEWDWEVKKNTQVTMEKLLNQFFHLYIHITKSQLYLVGPLRTSLPNFIGGKYILPQAVQSWGFQGEIVTLYNDHNELPKDQNNNIHTNHHVEPQRLLLWQGKKKNNLITTCEGGRCKVTIPGFNDPYLRKQVLTSVYNFCGIIQCITE